MPQIGRICCLDTNFYAAFRLFSELVQTKILKYRDIKSFIDVAASDLNIPQSVQGIV